MLTCCRLALPNDLMTHGGAFAERELLLLQLFAFVMGFFFFFFFAAFCATHLQEIMVTPFLWLSLGLSISKRLHKSLRRIGFRVLVPSCLFVVWFRQFGF